MQISEQDKWWLIGWLEGEGSFLCGPPSKPNSPSIVGVSTDEDVIRRVSKLFNVSYYETKRKRKNPKHKKVWRVCKKCYDAVEFMKQIQPYMSQRRKAQIDRVVASYRPNKRKILTKDVIVQIRELCQTNVRQQDIAEKFGITREMVNKIHRKKVHV